MNIHGIPGDVVTIVVGLTIADPRLEPTPRRQHRKAPRMMIPPVVGRRQRPLRIHRPPELPTPQHQRVVKQPPLLQVGQQRRRRLVGILALPANLLGQAPVLVPSPVEELNEPHAPLRQPPRQNAVGCIAARLPALRPVEREGRLRLLRQIRQLRHRSLHAERHLVLRNPRGDLRVLILIELQPVQLPEIVEKPSPRRPVITLRIAQIQHRILPAPELHPLMTRRNKPGTPHPVRQRLRVPAALRNHHHKRGQILILAPQPVGDPRADRRPARQLKPGLKEGHGRVMVDLLGRQRLQDRPSVGVLGHVRQQFAEPRPGLPVLGKLKQAGRGGKRRLVGRHPGQPLPPPDGIRQILAPHFGQIRLVVEQIELRRPSVLEQRNHALGLRRMVQHRPFGIAVLGEQRR